MQEESNQATNLDVLVRAEKLQLLFRQSFPAAVISFVISILLTAILWPVQDHTILSIWFGLLMLSSIVRLTYFIRYRNHTLPIEGLLVWEKPFFLSLMISSLLWGFGGVLIMPEGSPYHQAIIFYFLIGMSGGAISVYSAHRLMTLLTVAFVLLPATMWMLLQGNLASVGMGISAIIFFVSLMRATKVLSSALHQNFLMNHQLKKSKEDAEYLARRDVLTGLYNRRAFYEQAEIMNSYAERHEETLALIIMDIDYFKNINDKHGHAAGDAVLAHIGKLLQQLTRRSDVCARIGGEEFGILLLSTNLLDASVLAEKLRQEIADSPLEFENSGIPVTASFGVAGDEPDFDTLYKDADAAMYRAKKAGRNQVVSD